VTVEAVGAGVEDAVRVPADVEVFAIERNVLGHAERLDPVETLGDISPVSLRIFLNPPNRRLVACRVHVGPAGPIFGNRKYKVFAHDVSPISTALPGVCGE